MQKLELLAPAKNLDLGKIAISHGADAVYIAGPCFGAREAAGNSLADIETLVKYAHQYYAKVYLVVNTILYENELNSAQQLAIDAYNIGCDALIVQDMAMLEMDLPPIPLFASTQTNNQSVEHIKMLEDLGFSRVILARELSLKQIAEIRAHTQVELESFVHGSLCVSYSGQCYLSSALTGRSANRGSCAQPCRSTYDVLDKNNRIIAKNKHILSLRDLNLSAHLDDLVAAGISSFKIEGRLKDASYIKNVVALYRKKLDSILSNSTQYTKASSGKVTTKFEPDASLSFSRGFTNYFVDGKRKQMATIDTAKSLGEKIGVVHSTEKNYFTIKSDKALNNGDGICFFNKKRQLQGTKVNKIEGKQIFPLSMDNIKEGTIIFRSYNRLFEKAMEQNTATRLIDAKITFTSNQNNIIITVCDEDNNTATINIPQNGETAQNTDLAKKNIIVNISKTGDSIFNFDVEIDMPQVYFYPISVINEWRRRVVTLLMQKRANNYPKPAYKQHKQNTNFYQDKLSYTANVSNSLAKQFYKNIGVRDIDNAFELNTPKKNVVLMFNKYCIRYELGICTGSNADDLFLLNNGRKLRLVFDCSKCQMKVLKED